MEVYELTAKQILNTLQIEELELEEHHSLTSIKVSLDYSIQFLRKNHYDTVRFFAMFGLLPGGILSDSLVKIWG